jgi:hypothetical protein
MDNIVRLLEEARQKVIQGLGSDALLPSGELKGKYENTPLGKEYREIKERKDETEYCFFSHRGRRVHRVLVYSLRSVCALREIFNGYPASRH